MIVANRNAAAAERVATALGANARSVHADVTRPADVATMLDAAQAHFGGLHSLVNNAGIGHVPRPMEELAEDEFDRILAVNVKAIYLAERAVVPCFKQQNSGVILNIASTAGVSPRPRLTWCNASKGWVITAMRSMAVELAPFCIRVNALNPGEGWGEGRRAAHQPKAASSTSTQCRTGVAVPVCRCWMQPMFADTMTCASIGARFASLRSRNW